MERSDKDKSLEELVQEGKQQRNMPRQKFQRNNYSKRRDNNYNNNYGQYQRQRDRSFSNGGKWIPGWKVFVSNLAYETGWKSLKDYMREIGDVLRADIVEDDRGRSRGYGIVEFKTREEAIRAIEELNNTTLDGRQIYLKEDNQQKKFDNQQPRRKRSRSRSLSIHKNSENQQRQIYIGNLPFSVTKQQLRQAFEEFGTILFYDIPSDEFGRSRGFGIVLFSKREEAEKAIQVMDQAKFNDREVAVRLDKKG